ncbi:hypothetical protein VP01_1666g2 [Puccinia sorghi]|uniref:Uncharacterized protein n=1 Tax=Puccinia sorghi TaxID=27349 RepID=A0A0L6VG85_9BASI|nr:hypothetical protein VP01_1666g2 [Puccinia sorghi]
MAIYSLPSLRQPESITPQFYFSSQSFVAKAQADIDNLLNTWQQSITATALKKQQQGPFLRFKSIYAKLGWIYIHLAVIDPALRKHWFNSLTRLFLNNLKHPEPLKQIATIFALYALWGTQPPESVLGPKHFIVIDPETKEYLDNFPEKHAEQLNKYFKDSIDESFQQTNNTTKNVNNQQQQRQSNSSALSIKHRAHLDPNIFGPPPPMIKPSHSLYQVLRNLREQNAFIIQPTQTALIYPPLPTNWLSQENSNDPSQQPPHPFDHPQPAQKIASISSHKFDSTAIDELITSTRNELTKTQKDDPLSLCDPIELNRLRNSYLDTKSFLTGQQQQASLSLSPSSSSAAPSVRNQEPPDPLTRELFAEAIGMTRKVIQKTGPGLDHLLFPNDHRSSFQSNPTTNNNNQNSNLEDEHSNGDDPQLNSLDAFFLVDQANSIPELQKLLSNTNH